MALFQVEGWDLKSTVVKAGGQSSKKNKKRKQQDEDIGDIISGERVEKKGEENKAKKAKKNKSKKDLPVNTEATGTEATRNDVAEQVNETPAAPQLDIPMRAKLTPLQQKMMTKLTGSRFRWINEQLYTISSEEALQLVKDQPSVFDEYHDGFRSQVKSWPENPVDVFVNEVKERSLRPVNAPGGLPGLQKDKKVVIADMGCGEAQFALDIQNFLTQRNTPKKKSGKNSGRSSHKLDIKVHSFDLKKANERITAADIRNVPLEDNSCTVVIFCLALMGTNFLDFIEEAYRILAPRGELWIAEIKSRFSDKDGKGDEFVNALKLMGFFHKKTDDDNKMFTRFEFFKPPPDILAERKAKLERKKKFIEHEDEKEQLQKKREKVPEGKWLLKPCIYKRR